MKVEIAKYQQIAADIAAKISCGDYREGEKIYVRSALASQYGVSSETARRAMYVLSDMKIVEITKGSGVLIISKEKATAFINKFDSVSQMSDLKKNILDCVEEQIKKNIDLKEMVSELMYRTERFRSANLFTPFQIKLTSKASCIGMCVADSQFWHNTTATIVSILHDEEMIISPGPYAVFSEGDTLYYVGDENCNERVKAFIYPHQ